MLTLFSIPKPFEGNIAVIQRNAIQSWTRLHPDCEVILCGDDYGTKEAAAEFRAKYLPGIARNQYGTPLVNSAFEQAEKAASHSLLCFVNTDIILLANFLTVVKSIGFKNFLMVGRRWDLELTELLRFEVGWEEVLQDSLSQHGSLHPPTGIDYFVFRRGTVGKLPPFAVGRPGWDNWFVYRARALGVPVIDATGVVTVVHQNHGYAHVRDATDHTTEGPEAKENRALIGGWENIFTIRDATHFLIQARSVSMDGPCLLRRNLRTLPFPVLRLCKKVGYIFGAGKRAIKRRLAAIR